MITIEEFKQAIDSLSPEVHNQAKELVKTWTENMNRISEEPKLSIDESDELEQIADEGQIQDIYHSLEDNQEKAYQEIIDQVNAEYGDGGVLQFYSLQGIKEYFEIVHIETQELTSVGFKTAVQC
jgi:hypothetical protein